MKKMQLFVFGLLFCGVCIAQLGAESRAPSVQDNIQMMYDEYDFNDQQKEFIKEYFTKINDKSVSLEVKKSLLQKASTLVDGEALDVMKSFYPKQVTGKTVTGKL